MASLQLAAAVQTGDGWFGLILALLNVLQTVALAWMAGRSTRRRADDPMPRRRRRLRR